MSLKEIKINANPNSTKTIVFFEPIDPIHGCGLRDLPSDARELEKILFENLPAITFVSLIKLLKKRGI